MARLGLYDDALWVRYKKGEFDSDLTVILTTSDSEESIRVSKSALLELSPILGDMADSGKLTIDELSQQQLENFVSALYGKPLGYTCSVEDALAFSHFSHKYNISTEAVYPLICDARNKPRWDVLIKLYNNLPEECTDLQDRVILKILDYTDPPGEELVIRPRHLNELLRRLEFLPAKIVSVLQGIIDKPPRMLSMMDIAVEIPIDGLNKGCDNSEEQKRWRITADNAKGVLLKLGIHYKQAGGCAFCAGLSHCAKILAYESTLAELRTNFVEQKRLVSKQAVQITDLLLQQKPRKQPKKAGQEVGQQDALGV